jgi:hypothetical protein
MDKTDLTLRLLGGVTLILVCGCHSPYSYRPYGYNGSPGIYAPMQPYQGTYPGAVPGTTYPGAVPGQPLAPNVAPGSSYGTPMYVPGQSVPGSDDTLEGDWNESTPDSTFDDDTGSIEPVPQPKDPDPYGSDDPMFDDNLGDSPGGDEVDSFGLLQPVARDDDQFTQPVSASARPAIQPVSKYGFDKVQYRWLRGVLKRDPNTGKLQIVYAFGSKDKYGGDLEVANDVRFDQMRDAALVELRGVIDPHVTAADGEPIYRVTSARTFSPEEVSR